MTTVGKSVVGTLTALSLFIGFYTFGVSQGKDQLKSEVKELEMILMQKNEELKQLLKASPMNNDKLKSEMERYAKDIENLKAKINDKDKQIVQLTEKLKSPKFVGGIAHVPGDDNSDKGSKPVNAPTSVVSSTASNFKYQVDKCVKTNDELNCELSITNNGDVRDLTIYGNTRVFDEKSNEYRVARIKIADVENSTRPGSIGGAKKRMISEVPIKTHLTFGSVRRDVQKISLMEIYCNKSRLSHHKFKVELKNIPVF